MRLAGFKIKFGRRFGALVPFFVIAVGLSAHAADSSAGADYLGLKLDLIGSSFQSPAAKSVLVGPSIDFIYRHEFNANLDARADLAAEFFTGSTTGVMPSDLLGQMGPRQTFRLREAFVDAHTSERELSFKVGAINQRVWQNPLLGGDIAFLGALTEAKTQTAAGEVSVKLEAAVPPTSFSLLETAAGEQTPSFFAGQLGDLIGRKDEDFFEVTAGYFQFANLTTAQARQSLYWGNTVTGTTNTADFYLDYRGVEAGLRGGVKLSERWQGLAGVNAIQNLAAPGGAGTGYLGTLGAKYDLGGAKIGGNVGYLYDQSDSSPAVFSDGFLNSKDHRGITLEINYDAESYSVFARGLRTNALVAQPYAGAETAVLIGVEVRYDLLK